MDIAADDDSVDDDDDEENGPKDSKPAKRRVDDPEAAVDAAAAAAAAAASTSDDASAAFLSEKNKCDFALLLLSLLQTGEMEFETLLSKIKKISTPQFCHLYKRRMTDILRGGVHSLFDFRETGVEALLQVRRATRRRENTLDKWERIVKDVDFSRLVYGLTNDLERSRTVARNRIETHSQSLFPTSPRNRRRPILILYTRAVFSDSSSVVSIWLLKRRNSHK